MKNVGIKTIYRNMWLISYERIDDVFYLLWASKGIEINKSWLINKEKKNNRRLT